MTTAADMIHAAESHLGENGWSTWNWFNSHVYQAGYGWAWCAAFQSKIATECKLKHTDSASAAAFGNQFKRVSSPKAGDIVTFNWDGRQETSWMDHVALVTGVGSGCFYTIDGNSGGDNYTSTVRRNTYWLNAGYFCAFWRPTYAAAKYAPAGASRTYNGKWHYMNKNGVMGVYGSNMDYLSCNCKRYKVMDHYGKWYNWITQYNPSDLDYGAAGDNKAIMGLAIDDSRVEYRVHLKGKKYTSGTNKGKYKWEAWVPGDGKLRKYSKLIDKIQIRLKSK